MRLADWPRAENRARINSLMNGNPPYPPEEAKRNQIATNVNFLEATTLAHDARSQFYNAFCSPDPLFQVTLDYGPKHKRGEWAQRITSRINRIIKASKPYLETRRGMFANLVLHGIGPSAWPDKQRWRPKDLGIEDILVPSNTTLDMDNLPFFAVYRQYTPMQLWKATHGPKVDPGWNVSLANKAIAWADEEARRLMGATWPEVWSPEKMEERIKSDGGLYASDAVPTIDCFDLYFWEDDGKASGWKRRIVLDAWGSPGVGGVGASIDNRKLDFSKSKFLYNSGKRSYGSNLSEIIHFQFADCSSVAPFRYHSVRSLGFLLYAVCHLQNRLRCKFNDAVFESLLQYFRVSNPEDEERLIKADLIDKGVIPEGLEFVKREDRWQVDGNLAEFALELNRQSLTDNSANFLQNYDLQKRDSAETATRTMAKVNASAQLVGAMLTQAYNYQAFQYREICRRFCIKNSRDPDVRQFRVQVLKDGVPEEAVCVDLWDVQPVRVIGAGNRMLQVAIADKLLAIRPLLDPSAQREVDRIYIAANSDDYDLTNRLVPETRTTSDSVHDAQLSAGTMLAGVPMAFKEGVNHSEYIEAMLAVMAVTVQDIETSGGMATPEQLRGLQLLAGQSVDGQPIPGNGVANHIAILAQDKSAKDRVRQYGDDLKNLMNYIRAYNQRLSEQMAEGNGNGGLDPKDAAKIQGQVLQAQVKSENTRKSHAERTAQRRIQFQEKVQQDREKHAFEMEKAQAEAALEIQKESASLEQARAKQKDA